MIYKLENAFKTYGYNDIFSDANLVISSGERVGIIGKNGCGKSTLLNILSGSETIEQGKLSLNETLKYVKLNQNNDFSQVINVFDFVTEALKDEEVFDYEIKAMLSKLGINKFDSLISSLSGGEQKRVDLTITLLKKGDVYLLDEPTNHLDSQMINWLESYLKKSKKTIICVSHDRYFLDQICTSIVDIDEAKIYKYEGNFTNAIEMRQARLIEKEAFNRRHKSIMRVEQKWASRGPQGRGTKSNERMDRFNELKQVNTYQEEKEMSITNVSSRLGNETIEITNASYQVDDKLLLNDFSYLFKHFDKIGILGANGSGKSTFLNLVAQVIKPTSGEVAHGSTVKIGYFTQHYEKLDERIKVIDYIKDIAPQIEIGKETFTASSMLDQFLFDKSVQHKYIESLSGGERRRLFLLGILMSKPNILILDEPTNDLDVITLQVLEAFLLSFSGIIITVSHDRYFLNKIINKAFIFTGDGEVTITNEINDELLSQKPSKPKVKKEVKQKPKQDKPKTKMSFNEKYEWENIDDKIQTLETKLSELDTKIASTTDFETINQLVTKRTLVQTEYDEVLNRWEYLFELSENM